MSAQPEPEIANPLLAEWERLCERAPHWPGDYDYRDERRWFDRGGRERGEPFPSGRVGRHTLCMEYAFAIPTLDALQRITELSPIVEVGAGTGYWAALLTRVGCDIIAFDCAPPRSGAETAWAFTGLHYPVAQADGPAVAAKHADRTLFLCWPPMDSMAFDALTAYQEAGGQRLIYIGEGVSGCTASEEFHALLENDWQDDEEAAPRPWASRGILDLPQWPGIHDRCYIYERREP